MKRFFIAWILLLLPSRFAQSAPPQQLLQALRANPNADTVQSLLPEISALLADEETALESLPVVEQASEILLPTAVEQGTGLATASLLKAAARLRYEQVEPAEAAKHLRKLRELQRQLVKSVPKRGDEQQQSRWNYEVVLEYLRGDQLPSALELLGEQVDRVTLISVEGDEGQAAVAGALYRRLDALTTDQRYELLHAWSMPTAERRTLRSFSSLASVETPPDVFARALGERPRANAFPIPEIGGVSGLFSSDWLLVRAAAESGRLRRLTTELEELVAAKVANADFTLLLAQLADESAKVDELKRSVDQRLQSPAPAAAPPGAPTSTVIAPLETLEELIVGAACLTRDELLGTGQRVFESLLERLPDTSPSYSRPFLRRARAIAILRQHEGADPRLLTDPGLKYWIPASEESAVRSATGAVREIWLVHEDHILHLAGPHNDYLCFRYPLTANFEFHVEAQNVTEYTFGNLAFGGLAYGVAGNADEFRVWGLDMGQMLNRPFPFVRKEQWPTYQRLVLRSTDKGVEHLVNGHPAWTDPLQNTTSPWLALRCFGDFVPAFRNFQLTGNLVIPREVHISDGNLLRGWFTQFYPSSVSRAVPLGADMVTADPSPIPAAVQDVTQYDWYLRDGVIHGSRREALFRSAVPSRLSYFRPLQDGERVMYEFLYEPGRHEVHPSLGRLAFLIEPNGVRVRWLTGGETEWTGLAENNATIEPLNRRGPRPLPLKSGEWNRVTLTLTQGVLSLELNEVEVYSRKMEEDNSQRFGLYHDRNRSAVQVRNVILRGDWPETLTQDDLNDLLAPRAGGKQVSTDGSQAQSRGDTLNERHVADAALMVHRAALALAPEARYTYLANYVLPGQNHDGLRLSLDYTPVNPAPEVADQDPLDELRVSLAAKSPRRSCIQVGGNLVSPALDLVHVARHLGRLEEVRDRVATAPQGTDLEQRRRLAMLAVIDIALGEFDMANDHLDQLFGLVELGEHTKFEERWPETLATYVALQTTATRNAGRELAIHLHLRQARNGADSGSQAWRRQITAWVGLSRYFAEATDPRPEQFSMAPGLRQWGVVDRHTAGSRGSGFPRSHWQRSDVGVDSLSRHDEDYLYYCSPLRGDYEVECDVAAFGWRDTQVMVAGEWLTPRFDFKAYSHGNFRRVLSYEPLSPPLMKPDAWMHYRIVVRDATACHFINGRLVQERALEQHADPWLAIRSDTPGDSAAQNVWITGQPEIPEVIELAETKDLGGWIPYYDSHTVSGNQAQWWSDLSEGGGIAGRRRPELAGMFAESLLRYHRPMLEDGTIEYSFFFRDGVCHCHPALDRLAFLLEPAGVREHWISDGSYDRTELAPDNVRAEPGNRRGPERLPLRNDAWNQCGVTIRSDLVQLSLNGQLIYERLLEPTNLRTFGLFHYADQTEVQVRNVSWHGSWPRTLPSIAEQELSGDHTVSLDESLASLPAHFEHDFKQSGFPSDDFAIMFGSPETFHTSPEGLRVDHQGSGGYQNATFTPRLNIHGDYDITAAYEQLGTDAALDGSCSLFLMASLKGDVETECLMMRRHSLPQRGPEQQFHQTAVVKYKPAGASRQYSRAIPSETRSGRLRMARRGTTVYFLFAEGDSPLFRLARTEELPASEIADGDLRIINQTHGPGRVHVVWTSLAIRAEKLSGSAIEGKSEAVLRLDRERTSLPIRFSHVFARDPFSPDRIHYWGFSPPSIPNGAGLLVAAPPADNWTSAGAAPRLPLSGDFDIAFDFDLLRMTPPKSGLHSDVYLQLELPDAAQRQYNMILVGEPNGAKYISAQLRERSPQGVNRYRSIGRELINQVGRMRLARRGRQLFFLFSPDLSQPDRLLAQHEITPVDIPSTYVRVFVHTGGTGTAVETAWKRLTINAK